MTNSQALRENPETQMVSAAWQQQAELLAHLSQFSQNILCVIAPPQAGKTQFLNYFMSLTHIGLKKHAIFNPPTKVDDLMKAVAQSLELPWKDKDLSEAQNDDDDERDETWALLVNDADKLSEESLFALLKLVRFDVEPKRQLHLILLGLPELERTLYGRNCQELIQGHCHTLELAPHEFIQAAPPTTAHKPRVKVKAESRSRLALDAELLSEEKPSTHFEKKNDQEHNQGATMSYGKNSTRGISQYLFHPVSFGAAAGIGLGIVYLMLNPLDDMEWQTPATNAAQLADVTYQSELMAQPTMAPTKLKVEIASSSIPEEESVNQQTIASKQIPLAEEVPELVQEEIVQATESVKKVSDAPKKGGRVIASNQYTAEEQYLLNIGGSRYTLQLMGGENESGLKQFIQEHQLESNAYTYRKEVNGKAWYVVVLGNYQSRQAAQEAAQQLPATVKQTVKPWIRNIGSIQSEIKASRGNA